MNKPGKTIRKQELKVIGAGFGRTGTLSLKAALEELGFGPCYHMSEAIKHPEHDELWLVAARGETVAWDTIFQDYQATVDWPGCAFYDVLLQTYPNAKVILTVRGPESWYESAYNTIYPHGLARATLPLAYALMPRLKIFGKLGEQIIWDGTFAGKFTDKAYTIKVFEEHNEEVKRRVPAERLLVYEVQKGWEPLCAFLGVPVPDKPFPHLNIGQNFARFIVSIRESRQLVGGLALIATLVVGTIFVLRRLLKYARGRRYGFWDGRSGA